MTLETTQLAHQMLTNELFYSEICLVLLFVLFLRFYFGYNFNFIFVVVRSRLLM